MPETPYWTNLRERSVEAGFDNDAKRKAKVQDWKKAVNKSTAEPFEMDAPGRQAPAAIWDTPETADGGQVYAAGDIPSTLSKEERALEDASLERDMGKGKGKGKGKPRYGAQTLADIDDAMTKGADPGTSKAVMDPSGKFGYTKNSDGSFTIHTDPNDPTVGKFNGRTVKAGSGKAYDSILSLWEGQGSKWQAPKGGEAPKGGAPAAAAAAPAAAAPPARQAHAAHAAAPPDPTGPTWPGKSETQTAADYSDIPFDKDPFTPPGGPTWPGKSENQTFEDYSSIPFDKDPFTAAREDAADVAYRKEAVLDKMSPEERAQYEPLLNSASGADLNALIQSIERTYALGAEDFFSRIDSGELGGDVRRR